MKKLLIVPLLALLVGCASFSTHVFRTEQMAVNVVYGAYVGYTNSLPLLHLTADQSNAVKRARLEFAASVAVLDNWRAAYETNAVDKSKVEAALNATLLNSSNVVWLITYIKAGGKL